MGLSSIDAKKWLQQRSSGPTRVASLVSRCLEGGLKPEEITVSGDLFVQILKELKQSSDIQELSVQLGECTLKLVRDDSTKGELITNKVEAS